MSEREVLHNLHLEPEKYMVKAKLVLWGCLLKRFGELLVKGGYTTFDVSLAPGAFFGNCICREIGDCESMEPKLWFPLIYIIDSDNKEGKCYGVWILFNSLEDAEKFAKAILEIVGFYKNAQNVKTVEELHREKLKNFKAEYVELVKKALKEADIEVTEKVEKDLEKEVVRRFRVILVGIPDVGTEVGNKEGGENC